MAHWKAALGPATVLVNNGSRDDRHAWQEVTPDYYDERIATRSGHMLFAIQAVAPGMIAAGKGSIINFRLQFLVAGDRRDAGLYLLQGRCSRMTRSFARDLGKHRIRATRSCQGWVMTERQKQLWVTPEALERHLERQCLPDR